MGNIVGTPFNSLANATPEQWPLAFIARFYASSIIGYMTNLDYEDVAIGPGTTIHLRQQPQVTVLPSTGNSDCRWSPIVVEQTTLTIDYAFDCAYQILNTERSKIDVDVEGGMQRDMLEMLRLAIETVVLGSIYASAYYQVNATAWETGTNCVSYIAKAAAYLSTGLAGGRDVVPNQNRYLAIHPLMKPAMITQTAFYALNQGTPKSALYEGYVGQVGGFEVLESPLIAGSGITGTPYHAIAGHPQGVTLATKFTSVEANIVLPNVFGTGTRCQNFAGFAVTKTNFLVDIAAVL